jgi:hypothetical protein
LRGGDSIAVSTKSALLTPAVDTRAHGAKLLNLRDSRAIATP